MWQEAAAGGAGLRAGKAEAPSAQEREWEEEVPSVSPSAPVPRKRKCLVLGIGIECKAATRRLENVRVGPKNSSKKAGALKCLQRVLKTKSFVLKA